MGDSAGTTKTTSTTGLPEWQQPYINTQFQSALDLLNKGFQQYPGSIIAPFAGSETVGQQYLEQAAGPLASYAQYALQPYLEQTLNKAGNQQFLPEMMGATGNIGNLIGQPYGVGYNQGNLATGTQGAPFYSPGTLEYAANLPQNIANDPKIQNAINAAVAPAFRGLTEQALPNIRTENVAQGTYGGSPQSLSQALATERTTRGAQEVGAQMMNQMWSQAMNNALTAQGLGQQYYTTEANRATQAALGTAALEQRGNLADIDRRLSGQEYLAGLYGGLYGQDAERALKAAGLSGVLTQATVAPGEILMGVGGQQRAMDAALRQEQAQKFETEQILPWRALGEYANLVRGPVGGVATSTVEGTPPAEWQQYLALALAGLGVTPEIIDLIRKIPDIFRRP